MKQFKRPFLFVLILLGYLHSLAQKRPNIQTNSMRAPAGVRIDGKTTEWNNAYQAHNKATDIFYTIANDDENLYLVIRPAVKGLNRKIMAGGITFTTNPIKKSKKNGVSVTYPIIAAEDKLSLSKSMASSGGGQQLTNPADEAKYRQRQDSMMAVMNKKGVDKIKTIKVLGIAAIQDTFISVYNDVGIMARLAIDAKGDLNYELSISLKHLGLSPADLTKFYYNIQLNAPASTARNGSVPNVVVVGDGPRPKVGGIDIMALASDTDFWGEYTLAKKQ